MDTYKVLIAPDPELKKIASKVDKVDLSIQKIIDKMLATMYKENGVGLAATQVGIHKRIIVIDLLEYSNDYPDVKFPLLLVNPEIISYSENTCLGKEGCLSIPGLQFDIKRYESINITYLDYNNKLQKLYAEDFLARAIQHEMDHLNGKLALDYISPLKKEFALKKLKNIAL